jgi:lactoylglutathione lyase
MRRLVIDGDEPSFQAKQSLKEEPMTVRRIVANVATANPRDAEGFYGELLGLEVVMDHGWIVTFADVGTAAPQVSFASEGGSGTPVPDLSIEVDDVDAIYGRAQSSGFEITYPITDEPWGVRRFFVRDPFGRLVNILSH